MNKTKTSFGLMILLFAVLIILVSIFFTNIYSFQTSFFKTTGSATSGVSDILSPRQKIINYTLGDCVFIPPENKTFLLRIDDLGAWHYFETVQQMIKEIDNRNLSASFGVIPYELEKDKPFVKMIRSIKNKPHFEIAQHGYTHEPDEFGNLDSIQAYILIEKGRQEIINNLRVVPITFIPPENEYNSDTLIALEKSGFKFISARDSEYSFEGLVAHIGQDAFTADYYEKRFVPVQEVLSNCEKIFASKNLCVINIHPQDYVQDENPEKIDNEKYTEFLNLLDEIKKSGLESLTFKDLIRC